MVIRKDDMRKVRVFCSHCEYAKVIFLDGRCKECYQERRRQYTIRTREHRREYKRQQKKNTPWLIAYFAMKNRCENPNNAAYHRYGGRGIRCVITKEELKEIWFRDNAWNLKEPSIDRKDNDGSYTKENCRFIEKRLNSSLGSLDAIKKNRLKNPNVKLNIEAVIAIKKEYRYGNTKILTKRYGVSRGAIYKIVNNLTWVKALKQEAELNKTKEYYGWV